MLVNLRTMYGKKLAFTEFKINLPVPTEILFQFLNVTQQTCDVIIYL